MALERLDQLLGRLALDHLVEDDLITLTMRDRREGRRNALPAAPLAADAVGEHVVTRLPVCHGLAAFLPEPMMREPGETTDEAANEVTDRLLTVPMGVIHGDGVAEIALELMKAWPGWPRMAVDDWGIRHDRRDPHGPPLFTLGPENSIVAIPDPRRGECPP